MANNIFENLTDEERSKLWMYMIYKIKERTEQLTKEAEEASMTLTEYLESISPLALEKEDCISRQAVLESIKNLYPDMPVIDIMDARRKWLKKYAPYFECENAVKHLPSVTPKQEPDTVVILDKIRADIIAKDKNVKTIRSDGCCFFTADEILNILNKYKEESEVRNK